MLVVYTTNDSISCFLVEWSARNDITLKTLYLPPTRSSPDITREANADHQAAELGFAQVEQLRVPGKLSADKVRVLSM